MVLGTQHGLMGQKGMIVKFLFRAALLFVACFLFCLRLNLYPLLCPPGSERLVGRLGGVPEFGYK